MYNRNGLIYFMNACTLNKSKNYFELSTDIRKIIWSFSHIYPIIQCYICDVVLFSIEINVNNQYDTENYSILNGLTVCQNCKSD